MEYDPLYGDRKQVPVRDCRWGRNEYNQYPGGTNSFVDIYIQMPKVIQFYTSLQQLIAKAKLFLISFETPKRNHLSLPFKNDFHKARHRVHTCDPHTWEAEAGGFAENLRLLLWGGRYFT